LASAATLQASSGAGNYTVYAVAVDRSTGMCHVVKNDKYIYIYIYIYIYTYIYSKNRASNFKVYAMAMDRSLGTGHARGYVS
jgi:hypothetical protein